MLAAARKELHVLRLQRVFVAGHLVAKRGVDESLDVRHRAIRRLQRHRFRAGLRQPARDPIEDADVGATETIDRLFRIADDEQRAVTNAGAIAVLGREQQQELGLQRIGVLELVDEEHAKPLLESPPYARPVAHEIARLDQEIEKVERPRLALAPLVARDAFAQLFAQQRRHIRVRVDRKSFEMCRAAARGDRESTGE